MIQLSLQLYANLASNRVFRKENRGNINPKNKERTAVESPGTEIKNAPKYN